MRVSEYYKLGRTQPGLDFVDVDIDADLPVFTDPRALRLLPSDWGAECVSLLQNFFETILSAIRSGRELDAKRLLSMLREPNETRLGLSKGRPRGRALGPVSAVSVWESLRRSDAVKSGLLQDLEDSILMIEGIGDDIISDITTNVIRAPLVTYTQEMCAYYGIPLEDDVDSGPLWDPGQHDWHSRYVALPVPANQKLVLVPKVIVRRRMDYNFDEYFKNYILEYLRERELSANSELVRTLKDGRRRVLTKDLVAKYGRGKGVVVRETLQKPELLDGYRGMKLRSFGRPLTQEALADEENAARPDWNALLQDVLRIATGPDASGDYEKKVEAFLTAIFYPSLTNPQPQARIHDGRKRIDITYTNSATRGFFHWVGQHYPAAHVFVECKNYGGEVGNPELDQISGRFSPSPGPRGSGRR